MEPTDSKPLVLEISNASIRRMPSTPISSPIWFMAPMVRSSSRLIFSLSWDNTRAAFLWASSTSRSFWPFCGTTIFTFWPRLVSSHWLITSASSSSVCTQSSRGTKGVPA